jgi:hypothetical protein
MLLPSRRGTAPEIPRAIQSQSIIQFLRGLMQKSIFNGEIAPESLKVTEFIMVLPMEVLT